MALPSPVKTWQYDVNNIATSEANLPWHQKILLAIKNAMIGFGSNAWSVAGSSDSSSFDMVGTDYWSAYTDLVWDAAGNPHSWIVLENVDSVQICFDLAYASTLPERMNTFMSPSGAFAGGSVTARPTAGDEININVDSPFYSWMGEETGTPNNYVWHMWHSTDGEVTRLVAYRNNIPNTIWRFEKFQNPRSGHTVPYGCGVYSGGNTEDRLTITRQEDNGVLHSDHGGVDLAVHCTGMGRNNNNVMERAEAAVAEEIDGEWWVTDVGYESPTIGGRGPKGQAFDLWWGQYQVISDGDTYPSNPLFRQFVQMGSFVFTWIGDATIPLTA
jgi:hypothetical protein